MGESYRGITIRIGADTSPLNSALRGIQNALRATQSELRQVTTALRFDPSSIENTKLKMMLLAEKSQEAFAKVEMLKTAQSQLGEKDVGNATVAELANEWTDVQFRVATTREELNKTNAALENLKIKFAEAAEKSNTSFDENNIEAEISKLQELGAISDEDANRYHMLVAAHNEFEKNLAIEEEVAEFERLKVNIAATEADARRLSVQFAEMKAASPFSGPIQENLTELRNKMQQTDATANTLENQLRQIDAAMKMNPDDIGAAALKMQNLQEQTSNAQTKMKNLQAQLSEMRDAGIDKISAGMENVTAHAEAAKAQFIEIDTKIRSIEGDISSMSSRLSDMHAHGEQNTAGYQELAGKIALARQEVSKLSEQSQVANEKMNTAYQVQQYRELGVEITETRTKMAGLNAQMGETSSRGQVALSTFKSLGMTFYATVTPAVLYFGYTAMTAAKEIDTSFRDMKKTVQGTDEQFAHLKQAAIDYSTTHVTTASQMLEIEAMGGQLGVATSQLESFAAVVSNIDIATDINADDAAKDIGQLENIMKDLNKDTLPGFSDALVRLGNNNATVESSIMDVTMRIGSMGGILGMSTPEVLAWSTAISSTGQNSEAAGTAMSKTMSDIEGAVGEGGDALQGFSDVAGMSAEQFAAEWKSSPSEALLSFVEGLKRVGEEGGSVDNTLEKLKITSVRQKQGLEGLTQETDTLTNALKMSSDAWNGVSDEWGQAGDAEREAKQKSEGFSGALQILKNDMADLGMVAGESLTPILQALQVVLQAATAGFNMLPGPMQTVITSALLLCAGLGPLLTIVSSVGTAMKDKAGNAANFMHTAFDKLVKGTTSLKEGLEEVNAANDAAATSIASTSTAWDVELAAMEEDAAASDAVVASKEAAAVASEEEAAANEAAAVSNVAYVESTVASDEATVASTEIKEVAAIGTSELAEANIVAAASEEALAAAEEEEAVASEVAQASAGALSAAVLVAVAAITIGAVAMANYVQHQDDMHNATTGLTDASSGLSAAIDTAMSATDNASDSAAGYVSKLKFVKVSAEELSQAQGKLASKINETNANAGANIASLEHYRTAIDGLVGATDTDSVAQLKVAVEGFNKACGTNYTVDEETGQILDQSGAAVDCADSIDKLAAAKEREIAVSALQDNEKEIYKQQANDAAALTQEQHNLAYAQQQYNEAIAAGDEGGAAYWGGVMTEAQGRIEDLKNEIKATEIALQNVRDEEALVTGATDDAVAAAMTASGNGAAINEGLKEHGARLMDLKKDISDVGASTDSLSRLSAADWGTIASTYDGSTASLIEGLKRVGINLDEAGKKTDEYNEKEPEDKHADVTVSYNTLVDATGHLTEYDGTPIYDKDGKAVVISDTVTDATGHITMYDGTPLNNKDGSAVVDSEAVREARDRIGDYNRTSLDDKSAVIRITQIFEQIGSWMDAGNAGNASGGILVARHATGGIIQPLATGAIVNRPTMMNLVGEDGAEAVIPLSNRKYVRPFAAAVAAEVAAMTSKNVSQQVTIININGTINDDKQIVDVTRAWVDTLKGKAMI